MGFTWANFPSCFLKFFTSLALLRSHYPLPFHSPFNMSSHLCTDWSWGQFTLDSFPYYWLNSALPTVTSVQVSYLCGKGLLCLATPVFPMFVQCLFTAPAQWVFVQRMNEHIQHSLWRAHWELGPQNPFTSSTTPDVLLLSRVDAGGTLLRNSASQLSQNATSRVDFCPWPDPPRTLTGLPVHLCLRTHAFLRYPSYPKCVLWESLQRE